MERLCDNCGKPFQPKRADAVYCGQACRQQAYMSRKNISAMQSERSIPYRTAPQTESTDKEQASGGAGTPVISTEEPSRPGINTEGNKTEKAYYSSFVDYIGNTVNSRNRVYFLAAFNYYYPLYSKWVNTRYLCLVESLLAISELRSIPLDDLKDICNAFHQFINSQVFEELPVDYPYWDEMNNYHDNLMKFCLQAEDETVTVRFSRNTKALLIASRYELTEIVHRVKFDQLDFGM